MDSVKLNKLFELVAEVGWDCHTIVDSKTNSIKGAVIGTYDIIDQLTGSDEPKKLKLEESEKKDLDLIYQKMIIESRTGFWIGEVSSTSAEVQSYNSYNEMLDAATSSVVELTMSQFEENIKINSICPFSLTSSDGTAIIFPSEEEAEKIYQKMKESTIK